MSRSVFFYDNTDCFSLKIEDISFTSVPQIVEAEQKLELQYGLSTNIGTDSNKANSKWKYNLDEVINLVHFLTIRFM